MNFRIAISLAALLLFAVNTALVISETPLCPYKDDGTLDALPGVPGSIPCPTPPNYDCDDEELEWEITGTQWIIQTGVGGPWVASSKGATHPIPGQPVAVWESFEADIIGKTGALCGGRKYTPISGDFRPNGSDNEDAFVMQGQDAPCHYTDECFWLYCGGLTAWELQENGYYRETKNKPNYCCTVSCFDTVANHQIWEPCSVNTGY